MDRDHFPNTNFLPEMTWQSLPPVPEQSLDSFFNPNYPIEPQFLKENIPNFGKLIINPNLPAVSADPGFAERAARFSPFGSRSFSARTSQLELNSTELQQVKSNCVLGNLKLARVSSTPSLRSNCSLSQVEIRPTVGSSTSPNEGSSVSEQIPILETEAKNPSDSSFRKRKSVSKGKTQKMEENQQDGQVTKHSKTSEHKEVGNVGVQKDEKQNEKQDEVSTKAPEPPKDYIHVRARRGQATDSHSLAERVRREKISKRMKLLQDLVPGCNKVTGKALMLDEIINYVQSLQRQVEFLSMKLASVNPEDFNTGSLLSKDVTNSTYPLESSSLFGQQKKDIHPTKADFLNGPITHCSLDPSVETMMFRDIGLQLPFVDEFGQGFPQFSGFFEDDLQSIVQMGFGQNSSTKSGFHSQSFPAGSSDTTNMSIEL